MNTMRHDPARVSDKALAPKLASEAGLMREAQDF